MAPDVDIWALKLGLGLDIGADLADRVVDVSKA